MKPRTLALLAALAFAGLLLAGALPAAPATAQTEAGPAEQPSLFVDTLDVDVVNVEVFVTDRDGNRVTGLSRDDFELYEDGEPVEITNFYTVEGGEVGPSGGGGEPAAAGRPEEPVAGEPHVARPPEQQLHLAIYVDNSRLHPGPRRKILEELEGFLETRLSEGDLVMMAESDRTLEIVEPFTHDHSRIVQALGRISRASASGPLAEAEYRRVLRMIPGLLSAPDRTGAIGGEGLQPGINSAGADHAYEMVKNYAQQQAAEVQRQAKTLRAMVRALAGLPGRKALLIVSGGMPQRPGEELFYYLETSSGSPALLEAMREDQRRVFNAITREANAHQVTLYTLDGNGATGRSSLSAEFSAEEAGVTDLNNAGRVALDGLRTQNLQEPLIHLADATGGQSILNTSNYDGALARAAVDFDAYYSLGYRSPGSGDGKLHEIEVRVERPGVRVRHRAGYVDKPQSERVADRTLSSLLLAVESNPLGVEIEIGEPQPKSDRRWYLPVMVRVPFERITLIPNGETQEGRLNLYLAVQDEHGVSDLHHHPYPVRVPSEELEEVKSRTLGYYAMLEIRPGTPTLAVGVWDELSGAESFVRREVEAREEREARRGPAR